MSTRDIEYVAFEKKCVDFNQEFACPHCGKRVFRVCVNLGMLAGGKFYCAGRSFEQDCSSRGCPKYGYNSWTELENYRNYGQVVKKVRRR